jgi:hypothetical protein
VSAQSVNGRNLDDVEGCKGEQGSGRPLVVGARAALRCLTAGLVAVSLSACAASVRHVDDATPTSSPLNRSPTTTSVPATSTTARSTITTTIPTTSSPRPAPPPTHPPTTRPRVTRQPGAVATALARLGSLAVKGRAPKTGYERDRFGPSWTDDVDVADGHNGCDTRNDILRRDLTNIVLKPGTRDCVVLTGTLHDPYTNKVIAFQRGVRTSTAVQIDHVVALLDAWQKGAQQLSAEQRRDLANDPIELLAVDGPTNAAKGAGDAATWLPPNKAFRCRYVALQVAVKVRYHLWVTQAEHDAIARILAGCTDAQVRDGR